MASLVHMHKSLLAQHDRLRGFVNRNQNTIGRMVKSGVHGVESVAGGAIGGALDAMLGGAPDANGVSEATVAGVPVVLSAGLAGKALAFFGQRGSADWGEHVHGVADGLLSYSAGVMTYRLARQMGA